MVYHYRERPSFDLIITTRYDTNFTSVTHDRDKDGKKIIIVQSNLGNYALPPKDSGYIFPGGQNMTKIREETKIETEPKCLEDYPTYVVFTERDLYSDDKEVIKKCTMVFEMRTLFLKQQYKRVERAAKFYGFDKLRPYPDFLQELMGKHIVGDPIEEDWTRQLLEFIEEQNYCHKLRILPTSQEYQTSFTTRIDPVPFSINHFAKNILGGLLDSAPCDWTAYINSEHTLISEYSTFKTTERDCLNKAREKMALQWKKEFGEETEMKNCEIVLFNNKLEVTEGSITNIAVPVSEGGVVKYITPRLTTGCLCGIMRYYLLAKGLIHEGDLTLGDLKPGSKIIIFNGVMGVKKAELRSMATLTMNGRN